MQYYPLKVSWRVVPQILLVFVCGLAAPSVYAQAFEPVQIKPIPLDYEAGFDPTLNCDPTPLEGPDMREIGLAASLNAARERKLSGFYLADVFKWAEREADPRHIPVLKRLVEEYRCSHYHAHLAFLAIEAAGEPTDYLVGYAQNWRRDDALADWAMNALAVRGDSTVNEVLRAVALEAPGRGKFGANLQIGYGAYVDGLRTWDAFYGYTLEAQLNYVGFGIAFEATRGGLERLPSGERVLLQGAGGNSYLSTIPRRAFQMLSEAYPTATRFAASAYTDTMRVRLVEKRGVDPADVPLHMSLSSELLNDALTTEAEIAALPRIDGQADLDGKRALIEPRVCLVDVEGRYSGTPGVFYPAGSLMARFDYSASIGEPMRVPYSPSNSVSSSSADGVPRLRLSPEVFFPDGSTAYHGRLRDRSFRFTIEPGETISWMLLGQTVTATTDTPRCDEKL